MGNDMKKRRSGNRLNRILAISALGLLFLLLFMGGFLLFGKDGETEAGFSEESSYVASGAVVTPSPMGDKLRDDAKEPDCGAEEVVTKEPEKVSDQEVISVSKSDTKKLDYDPKKPMIALTFDDGPSDKVTPRILEILEKNKVKATFFMLGVQVDKFPSLVKQVYEEGHEIGNHTISHVDLKGKTKKEVIEQVEGNNQKLNALVPVGDVLLRPPYGSYDDFLKENVSVPMMFWSVDTLDWQSQNKDAVIEEVLKEVKDGSVILMHDIYKSTADAIEILIPKLLEKGYQIVPVSEMFRLKQNELKPGHTYRYADSPAEEKIEE